MNSETKMNLYFIIAVVVITVLGCKAFEVYEDNKIVKKEVEQMLDFKDLTSNLKKDNLK